VLKASRRGVSTILGVLIFIGIMFTAIVPMQLVMHQADVIFEQNKLEVTREDEERDLEFIEVYPVPSLTEPEMNITLINTGEVLSTIQRVWVNNTNYPSWHQGLYYDVEAVVPALASVTIGPYPAPKVEGAEYDVKVTTNRGNVFYSEVGTIMYLDGGWVSETLGFRLIFPSRPGAGGSPPKRGNNWKNKILVTIEEETDGIYYENVTMYWAISASEKFFEVDQSGNYTITVYIWCSNWNCPYSSSHWEKVYENDHDLNWPEDDSIYILNYKINNDSYWPAFLELE